MKTHSSRLVLSALAIVAFGTLDAAESPPQRAFTGIWRNTDRNTGGLTRLAIYSGDKSGVIQAWGACTPDFCDLGPTQLQLVGDSVIDLDFDEAFAIWDLGFSHIYMVLHLAPGGLAVETVETFQDGSGRSSYSQSYALEKTLDPANSPRLGLTQELLAFYDFDQGGQDLLENSAPIDLTNAAVVDGVLLIPEFPIQAYIPPPASINGFSYDSFAVSVDFNPSSYSLGRSIILSGGPGYRWLLLNRNEQDQLTLSLNNHQFFYNLGGAARPGRWHKLICSVDLRAQQITTFLDGQPLAPIQLQNFKFEVIGTNFEQSDKAFSFWDFSDAENFSGMADNLKVYRRALTPSEMSSLSSSDLVAESAGGDVVVHWPASLSGYSLELADSLTQPLTWLPHTGQPLAFGDRQLVVFSATHSSAFFRLRHN